MTSPAPQQRMALAIELPWPPAELSGHNSGSWRAKSAIVKKHREWALMATTAERMRVGYSVPAQGDIPISFTFYPPDRRGDRTNYANRLKPAIDGIAQALGVNDRRFLPRYAFAEPVDNPRVTVIVG